jgi:hypothetical protein
MKATWAAGVFLGVAVLVANNPRKSRPQLPYRRLYAMVPIPLVSAAVCAGLLGLAGGLGAFPKTFVDAYCSQDWRPAHYMAVFGAHLGGYAGAAIGLALVIVRIVRLRNSMAEDVM